MWVPTKEIDERRSRHDGARLDSVHYPGRDRSRVCERGTSQPERLSELRSALVAFASAPLVTLEAHPLPTKRDRSRGLPLDAMSPLAQELSRLVTNSSKVPAVAQVAQSSEVLYRMHVPAKVATQFGKGLVKPMAAKTVDGGIYGDLVAGTGKNVIRAKAAFVPVEAAAAGGAKGTAVGAAAGTAAAGTALTVAAPLVLMAVAVGASAYADRERQKPPRTSLSSWRSSTSTNWSLSEVSSTVAATRSTRLRRFFWIGARSEHRSVSILLFTRSAPRRRTQKIG